MKKIKLVHKKEPDKQSVYTDHKKYDIYLGESRWLKFTTSKDCNYALAEINRQLNAILFELNELWISSFSEYRHIWFYLPPVTLQSEEMRIKDYNREIDNLMLKLATRSSWVNGNVFSFKYLYDFIKYLIKQYTIYSHIRKQKNQFLEHRINEVKITTLERIDESLKTLKVDPKYSTKGSKLA